MILYGKGYPIFAGESEHDQLLAIMEVIGTPEKKLLAVTFLFSFK